MLVAPSMLAADFGNMATEVKNIEKWGADIVHADVMDGVYVPNITFGMPMIKVFKQNSTLPIDAHLMITKPEKYVGKFCDAGADVVTFHPDASDDVQGALDIIKSKGKKCGLVVNADVDFDVVKPYLGQIDMLVIMTVQAGFGGQSFMPQCLEKAKLGAIEREKHGYKYLIEVDGGVSEKNVALLKEAGVDVAVAGSSVFKSEDPQKTIKSLHLQ
ncbi:MAG TPA: ribulose-phosphate 3-epimerase [Clostridiales bacterium]|nr:ribulose-phosphate 3-epimerase [Clostridiales bacterium]HBW06082.1 ribulose-phosphate 3-epimerase [Clostridiales bacterium]HCH92527.1 ribulose-phosphate 3-epimerase [Clostridiales bacterium]